MKHSATLSARHVATAVLAAGVLSGCAASIEPPGYAISGEPQKVATAASGPSTASAAEASGYQLNEEEKAADCGRLTGRMKIRIIALKDGMGRAQTSELSRSLHTATAAVGASGTGSDPYGDAKRDRAMLAAYNQQLAAKGCKTIDIENELKPGSQWETKSNPASSRP